MYRIFVRRLTACNTIYTPTSAILNNSKNVRCAVKLPFLQSATQLSDDVKSRLPLGKLIKEAEEEEKSKYEKAEEEKKQQERAWRTMKFSLIFMGSSFFFIGGYLVFTLGAPVNNPDGTTTSEDLNEKPVWQQYIIRTFRELTFYTRMLQEPSRPKLLPDPLEYPYIQPKYTVVLELTDVLVHPDWTYNTGWRFKKRPGLDYFLESLHGTFEIVVYTAEQGMTVFPLCEAIDPKNIIAYKLPRDTTHFTGGHHVKSLDKLNRDLSKVIVVDWNPHNVQLHPENLFQVKRWSGNDDDHAMVDLAAFLKSIADNEIEDVREVLENFRNFEDPLEAFKEKRKKLIDHLEADAEAKRHQEPSKVKRWAPSIFGGNKSL